MKASWNMGVLTGSCVLLGCVFGILIGGAIAPPVVDEPWLNSYQGLISAFVGISTAGVGLAVATNNVLRQMRINLMSREEDRIERLLPGIGDAEGLLHNLICSIEKWDKAGVERALKGFSLTQETDLDEYFTRHLPRTDEMTRQLVKGAVVLQINILPFAIPDTLFDQSKSPVVRIRDDLRKEIERLIARKDKMRGELESYFAD